MSEELPTPIHAIINDCEEAFGRRRWALFWTPFGPVLLLGDAVAQISAWTPEPPDKPSTT